MDKIYVIERADASWENIRMQDGFFIDKDEAIEYAQGEVWEVLRKEFNKQLRSVFGEARTEEWLKWQLDKLNGRWAGGETWRVLEFRRKGHGGLPWCTPKVVASITPSDHDEFDACTSELINHAEINRHCWALFEE